MTGDHVDLEAVKKCCYLQDYDDSYSALLRLQQRT